MKLGQDSLGLIDGSYTHVEYWETFKQNLPEIRPFEYENIPRGRVIYNAKKQKNYVYMDEKLLKTHIETSDRIFQIEV